MNTTCKVYVQGNVYLATVERKDTATYTATLLVCRLGKIINFYGQETRGEWTGERVAIFEWGDKFMEYVD